VRSNTQKKNSPVNILYIYSRDYIYLGSSNWVRGVDNMNDRTKYVTLLMIRRKIVHESYWIVLFSDFLCGFTAILCL